MKHGTDPLQGEFSICGEAFDAFDTGDADAPIVFAASGEVIECEDCRRVITYCKSIKGWKEP